MKDGPIICWDMDRTLGYFKSLREEFYGVNASRVSNKPGLRHGIKDLLERTFDEGFIHFLTTSAEGDCARYVLEKAGIARFFMEIFGYGDVGGLEHEKKYSPVVRHLGLSGNEAKRRMVVIGDDNFDAPYDLEGLVFIHHSEGYEYDSLVMDLVLRKLLEKGNGNFARGFGNIYEHFGTYFNICDGISFELAYRLQVPVIRVEASEQYRRPLTPI